MVRTNEITALEAVGLRWQTFVVLGVVLVALGIFAMGAASLATLASVLVFGWALIVGGILQTVHAIFQPRWGGRALDVLTGVLFVGVGVLTVWRPVESAIALWAIGFLVGIELLVDGVTMAMTGIAARSARRGRPEVRPPERPLTTTRGEPTRGEPLPAT